MAWGSSRRCRNPDFGALSDDARAELVGRTRARSTLILRRLTHSNRRDLLKRKCPVEP
jgi:hypothetical protein